MSCRKRSSGTRRSPQRLADSRAQEPPGLLESLANVRGVVVERDRAEKDGRDPEVAADLDRAHRCAREARVLDLAPQQRVHQPLNLGRDLVLSGALTRHGLDDLTCDLGPLVALDLIPDLDVVVVSHADAALGAGAHFVDVVLEAAQRLELAFEDHDVVA